MKKEQFLLDKEVVLVDWDWPGKNGPKYVEAIITTDHGNDRYSISLFKTLKLSDDSFHQKLIIEGRHKGYPITKIIPNFLRKIFIFNYTLSRIFAPLIAVNVSTENGFFFSIASVYLKSVYLKIHRIQGTVEQAVINSTAKD